MIYGTPPFHIETDVTDRIGIRTLIYSKMWQVSRWPLTDAEILAEKPAPPEVAGGLLLIGDETRKASGAYRTFWTYEGINGDGKSVTFKDRSNSLDYSFQPGFEQIDIRKHPKIQALKDAYGGQIDPASLEIIWPETISGRKDGTRIGLGAGGNNAGEKPNPMYGRNDYFQATGTYTFRYASFSPPSSAGVHRIHRGGLPGRAPSYPGCDWYQAPSPFTRRGVVFDISESYLLSGPGGWPVPIHELAAKL